MRLRCPKCGSERLTPITYVTPLRGMIALLAERSRYDRSSSAWGAERAPAPERSLGVRVAGSGHEGVRLANRLLPDFIYLDLRLPGLDGFGVLEQLRASPMTDGIPVIVLSNYSDPELVERGLKLGATGFLIKADTTPRHLSDAVARTTSGRVSVAR